MNSSFGQSAWVVGLCATVAMSAGCVGSEGKLAASQVAARVGGDEISIHQVNGVLARAPGVTAENAGKARREILERLVDQQLAVQQATERKLDRTPEVMMAMESARREILARALVDQLMAGQPVVPEEEARAYYEAHPELFSKRRIYEVQEIAIQMPGVPVEHLRELAAAGKSMDDIGASLDRQGISYQLSSITRGAEQLPTDTLASLQALRDGQSVVLERPPRGIFIVHLAGSRLAPIDRAAALPRIQLFLAGQRAAELAKRQIEDMKGKVKIEYLGEFAAAAQLAPATPPVLAHSAGGLK